ncbi:MAG: hypothetical protein HYU71_15760 [Bacteroidetes bacterium]|nr:hypothetical protein [Bacteroidota bacterium]
MATGQEIYSESEQERHLYMAGLVVKQWEEVITAQERHELEAWLAL